MMVSEFFSHGKKRYNDTYIHIKACTCAFIYISDIYSFMLALLFQKQECDQTGRWLFYKEILKSLLLLIFLLYSSTSQCAAMIILNWSVRDSSPGLAYSVSLWCTGTYILLLLLLTTIATINSFKCCIRFY